MSISAHDITIPGDLKGCQILLQELAQTIAGKDEAIACKDRTIDIQSQTITLLEQENEELQLAFNKLLQRAFGNRSERYLDNPDQLRLDFKDSDEAADAALGLADAVEDLQQTIPQHQRRKPGKKRDESLPAHFPLYEVVATVSKETKTCSEHGERTLLPETMWDTTETLEFERPKVRVRVTKYPKYACPGQPQCGISSPARPPSLVEGNKYDTSRPPASMLAVPAPRSSLANTLTTCRCTACRITLPAAAGRRRGARSAIFFRSLILWSSRCWTSSKPQYKTIRSWAPTIRG